METVDDEFLEATEQFIEKQVKADKPFFTWFNTTRMHNFTHVPEAYQGKTGAGFYADGVKQHDDQIGHLLNKIKELGVDDNTIIVYTTDNGPMINLWPDAGIAAGNSKVKDELLKGKKVDNISYKVHLDGYNQLPYLTGKTDQSARNEFVYWSDDGDLLALRYGKYKYHFMIQENETGLAIWQKPFTKLRVPKIFDLSIDPFERGDTGMGYDTWMYERSFLMMPAIEKVQEVMGTFKFVPK